MGEKQLTHEEILTKLVELTTGDRILWFEGKSPDPREKFFETRAGDFNLWCAECFRDEDGKLPACFGIDTDEYEPGERPKSIDVWEGDDEEELLIKAIKAQHKRHPEFTLEYRQEAERFLNELAAERRGP